MMDTRIEKLLRFQKVTIVLGFVDLTLSSVFAFSLRLRSSDRRDDPVDAGFEVFLNFVLPEPDHRPPHLTEFAVVYGITLPILRYFFFPEVRHFVFPRGELISVPEVAVHEDGDPSLAENDIRPAGKVFDVLAEPQASPVKRRPHPHLQFRILSLDAGHAVTALLRRQVIRHLPVLDTG